MLRLVKTAFSLSNGSRVMARRISRKKSANFISDPSSVNVRLPLANKTFHIRHFRYGSPTTVKSVETQP